MLFTMAMLCVYRIGFYIALPGLDAPTMRKTIEGSSGDTSAFTMLSNYLSVFSGGDLTQGSIFGLGIMPYISASIILQLLGTVVPSLEKLKKEGEPGIRKINEWTRYLTVAVCVIQAIMYASRISIRRRGRRIFIYQGACRSNLRWTVSSCCAWSCLTAGYWSSLCGWASRSTPMASATVSR